MPRTFDYLVSGRVQGVNFRSFAASSAKKYGVKGWVQNTSGGDVSGQAQGDSDALEKFKQALQQGPSSARVSDLKISKEGEVDKLEFSSFEVR